MERSMGRTTEPESYAAHEFLNGQRKLPIVRMLDRASIHLSRPAIQTRELA